MAYWCLHTAGGSIGGVNKRTVIAATIVGGPASWPSPRFFNKYNTAAGLTGIATQDNTLLLLLVVKLAVA